MKKATQFGVSILLFAFGQAQAQTATPGTPGPVAPPPATATTTNNLPSGLQPIFQAIGSVQTNWDFIGGYGRSLTGNNNVAFADVAFNFNNNVGVVLGYDHLWSKNTSQDNFVKGGATISAQLGSPFSFISPDLLPNVVTIPFVADLLATPKGNNAIGNIVTTGVDFEFRVTKCDLKNPTPPQFFLDTGVQYANRSGQGTWSANYVLFHLGISRRF